MGAPARAPRTGRRAAAAAACLGCCLLATCGGGIWIGFGDGEGDGRKPSVGLAAAAGPVAAGGTLAVAAAAADADGIDEVAFYRRDGGRWVFLGADRQAPYEWTIPVPADGRTTLEVFARATDRSGAQADSAIVVVAVRA